MDQFYTRQGIYQAVEITLYKADGTVSTDYTTDNVLSSTLWGGDQTASLSSPAVSWVDPTQGTITAVFKAADTSPLPSGSYLFTIELSLTGDLAGETLEVYRANLVVEDSPGSQAPPKTYCSYSDLLDYAPQLGKEQTLQTQTGFAEARGIAKEWIDEVILAHDRRRHLYIKQLLDGDKLIVSTKVKRIAVKKALSIIFGSAFSASKEVTTYTDFAAKMSSQANSEIGSLVAWFDSDGDGIPDCKVDCGILSVRPRDIRWRYL